MSSPNAKEHYSKWDRLRIYFHQKIFHSSRIQKLAAHLSKYVPNGGKILDLGCGDLSLIDCLNKKANFLCCIGADIWPLRSEIPEGCKYVEISTEEALPWIENAFDMVLLVDVLHHCEDKLSVLNEALRVGKCVLIKDHFESGSFSRQLLRFMDYVGNSAYGIPIPKYYFNHTRFEELLIAANAKMLYPVDQNVPLYGAVPIFGKKLKMLHFVAVVEKAVS